MNEDDIKLDDELIEDEVEAHVEPVVIVDGKPMLYRDFLAQSVTIH